MHPDPDGTRRPRPAARRRGRSATVRVRRRWSWLLALPLLVAGASVIPVIALRWADPPLSAFMLGARLEAWREGQDNFLLDQRWQPLAAISPDLALAVIAAEDQKFPFHRGFDLDAVRDALHTRRSGGRLRGASTITQQLAKNLFLWSGRSWIRKALEAWFTLWLEVVLPKARILELYLNLAEFGPGVYGAGAASARFYGREPRHLTAREAARLAALLPAPRRLGVHDDTPYMRDRERWILRHMQQLGGRAYLVRIIGS